MDPFSSRTLNLDAFLKRKQIAGDGPNNLWLMSQRWEVKIPRQYLLARLLRFRLWWHAFWLILYLIRWAKAAFFGGSDRSAFGFRFYRSIWSEVGRALFVYMFCFLRINKTAQNGSFRVGQYARLVSDAIIDSSIVRECQYIHFGISKLMVDRWAGGCLSG